MPGPLTLLAAGIAAALFFGLAIAFLDLRDVPRIIATVDPLLLLLSVLTLPLSFVARAVRWHLFLARHTGVRAGDLYWITSIGFLINAALPVRIGEVARAVAVRGRTGIGVLDAFGTIVLERLLDLMVVLSLTFLTLISLPVTIQLPAWLDATIFVAGAITLAGLLVLPAGVARPTATIGIVRGLAGGLHLPVRIRMSIVRGFAQAVETLATFLRRPRDIVLALVYSVLVWLVQLLGFDLLLRAFHLQANPTLVVAAFVLTTLVTILPAPPASVGTFEFFWRVILTALGLVAAPTALAIAITAHVTGLIVIFALGAAGAAWIGVSLSTLAHARLQEA